MPAITAYNPRNAPKPADWLDTREDEQHRLVRKFHAYRGLKAGNDRLHAALHVIVETRLAMDDGPTVRAMARLREEGLNRHDAVHAIGWVFSSHFYDTMHGEENPDVASLDAAVDAELEKLTAAAWHDAFRDED